MMSHLSPEEVRFFETGDASALQPDAAAPAPAPGNEPVLSPVDLNGLGTAPAPAPAAPAPAPAPADEQARGPDGKFVAATPAAPAAPAPAPAAPDVSAELMQRLAETQAQLAELKAAVTAPPKAAPPAEPPAPDPATDPLGAMMHNLNQLQKQIQSLKETQEQTTHQTEQQRNFQAFQTQVINLKDEFQKTTPDFPDAFQHLRATRAADLAAMGLTQAQVNETLFREEVAISERALREGKNPAAVAYEMAKRHGYVPKQAAAPAAAPAAPDPEAIRRAQAAGRQLPASPPANGVEINPEALRQASDADINRLVTNEAAWQKFTRGDQYPL